MQPQRQKRKQTKERTLYQVVITQRFKYLVKSYKIKLNFLTDNNYLKENKPAITVKNNNNVNEVVKTPILK